MPRNCLAHDDRIEIPEGTTAVIDQPGHPIVAGIPGQWPLLLGINEVTAKPDRHVSVIASLPSDQGGHPLLVAGTHGQGRTVAWTSDIGPHWLSPNFCAWKGYRQLCIQMLALMTAGT